MLAAATEQEVTVEQATLALKDRLIVEPALDDTERERFPQLLGVELSESVSEVDAETLEAGLRSLCNALVLSPQFQLAADHEVVASELAFAVDETDACADVAAALEAVGLSLTCG